MITQEMNETRFGQFAAEVLSDTGGRLLKQQSDIAGTYLRRTGWLADKLASGIYSVTETEDGANMVINYPARIRFLDLKRAASGKMKKVYYPIYNKPFYGIVYGYAIARIRAALNTNIRGAMATEGTLKVDISPGNLKKAKRMGFSDERIDIQIPVKNRT